MIHIDRSRIPAPKELNPQENRIVARENEEAKEFFGNQEHKRGQNRFKFKAFSHRNIKKTLTEMFHDKCAYCESKMSHVITLQRRNLKHIGAT